MLVVESREGLVVLDEPCPTAPSSIPATGASASPFVATVVVVLGEVVVVSATSVMLLVLVLVLVLVPVLLLVLGESAATFGTAVHRRPLMVVRKAPGGSPLDAIL